MSRQQVTRALISVSDKGGVTAFGQALSTIGVEILSTGGTHQALAKANIEAREVSEVTGFPELMDGRVKTLHPAIHGGILGRRGQDDAAMAAHGIAPIDLVVVNLYPFGQVANRDDSTVEDVIENIDIGGTALIRAAAKNYANVVVLVDPADYLMVIDEMLQGGTTEIFRFKLATKAFNHVARYDADIHRYLSACVFDDDDSPEPASGPREKEEPSFELSTHLTSHIDDD